MFVGFAVEQQNGKYTNATHTINVVYVVWSSQFEMLNVMSKAEIENRNRASKKKRQKHGVGNTHTHTFAVQ